MVIYRGQILASTSLDTQGERFTKSQLEKLCGLMGEKFLLHVHHDMAQPPRGYVENLRVEPIENAIEEWALVGDVSVLAGPLEEALGGFSVSFVEPLREVSNPTSAIYLPFPFYNDDDLITQLSLDTSLGIGRWVKKSADTDYSAIFQAMVAFSLVQPMWDDFYKEHVSPIVSRFIKDHLAVLTAKKIKLEHVQIIAFGTREVELRFIPNQQRLDACFSEKLLLQGQELARMKLIELQSTDMRVTRIVLGYDPIGREYFIQRVEAALD